MTLECIRAFGNFKPGDLIAEVPDGAEFDTFHFKAADKKKAKPERNHSDEDARPLYPKA